MGFKSNVNYSGHNILRTDRRLFQDMEGSVVPKHFWNNVEDFCKNGMGFSLIYEDKIASTAYSSYIHDDQFEFGIETIERFRGKGFASYVCSALIDYCLDNGYEPVWSCRLENTGSYKLAQRIGFEPTIYLPYYRLAG